MPLGNSLIFEAGLCVPKIDVVSDELSILISGLISKYPFQRKTDIFQLVVSTIVVAVDNNLGMEDIRIMLQMHPPHLVDVTDHSQVGMGKLRIGTITFNHSDLASLRPGKWINDQVIHAYLNLLMHEHHGKVYILPSFLGLKWNKSQYGEWLYDKVCC
ncbi:hypothetical protein HOLleu_01954 [Holothuria leucospilota]|uniref:Uncharacterized protein n=1 Tax=Holothuria leucospilota TaxID=206669 RepID=A0A9Q1HGQ8_HOLLE|nr:hypothetical protein HOLleu_01952 [Holothuria leucospilota]KAJ8049274.1 hypothetical protein HOLleu_01954 [Holothuria leucospilota]